MGAIDMRSAEQVGLEIIADYMQAVSRNYELECLYRGHADRTWQVVASIFREGAYGINKQDHLSKWKSVAQRFVSPKPVDDVGYLVLAQHYGVATALLDWTSNPLTALFFACSNHDKATGQVVQVSRSQFVFAEYTLMMTPFADNRPLPMLIDTSAMNLRSTAQDSFMSLHTRATPGAITKPIFEVEHKDKFKVRAALTLVGLTAGRVYADLAVAATHFKDDMEFEWLL